MWGHLTSDIVTSRSVKMTQVISHCNLLVRKAKHLTWLTYSPREYRDRLGDVVDMGDCWHATCTMTRG